MNKGNSLLILALAALSLTATVNAEETNKNQKHLSEKEVLELQVKTQTLINILVQKGIIDAETARALTAKAEKEAAKQYGEATDVVADSKKDQSAVKEPDVVRVPYVSKAVTDQIRNDVKKELQTDVVNAVMKKAETERWGVKDSWPAWVQKIKLSGDLRVREEWVRFAENNSNQYIDVLAVNKAGGTVPAGLSAFLNTTESFDRSRLRARLGLDVAVNKNWDLSFRLATGNGTSPISTNTTETNYSTDPSFYLDRAYVSYHDNERTQQLWVGRFPNPFLSTELVWDEDLNFNGIAGTWAPWHDVAPYQGGIDPYVTLGAFPIQHVELGKSKSLYGAQTGFSFEFDNLNTFKMGLAYYGYQNIAGQFNSFGSNLLDYTAPQFAQKGNTLFDIRNDDKTTTQLAALASNYREGDLTMVYDVVSFAPKHIILSADYVKNLGYDAKERLAALEKSSGLDFGSKDIEKHVAGYYFNVLVGVPKIAKAGEWNFEMGYRHLEQDAVLDAFSDSDFHLGGTDGKGYTLSGQYGVADNVSMRLRLLSGNEINGAPLGVDTWQLDLNVKF